MRNAQNTRAPNTPQHVHIYPTDTEDTTITAKEALQIAHFFGKKVTIATLHNWLEYHKESRLHHQPKGVGGRHYVFKLAFLRFIKGEEPC